MSVLAAKCGPLVRLYNHGITCTAEKLRVILHHHSDSVLRASFSTFMGKHRQWRKGYAESDRSFCFIDKQPRSRAVMSKNGKKSLDGTTYPIQPVTTYAVHGNHQGLEIRHQSVKVGSLLSQMKEIWEHRRTHQCTHGNATSVLQKRIGCIEEFHASKQPLQSPTMS